MSSCQRDRTAQLTVTRLFVSAERHARIEVIVAIDVHDARLQLRGETMCAAQVPVQLIAIYFLSNTIATLLSNDGRRQSVRCVVGTKQYLYQILRATPSIPHLLIRIERQHARDGAEDLLADDFHRVGDVGNDARRYVVAIGAAGVRNAHAFATNQYSCTLADHAFAAQ